MTEQIQGLLQHPIYRARLTHLEELEKERIYCGHDLEHFLRVGHIAEQVVEKNQLSLPAEAIWGAALLHDMGRVEQYQQGISHDKASVAFAREILFSLKWDDEVIDMICEAVGAHSHRKNVKDRWEKMTELSSLGEVLSFADHFSRKCYCCQAADSCKWSEHEKIDKAYF